MKYECRKIPILCKMEISNWQHQHLLGVVKNADSGLITDLMNQKTLRKGPGISVLPNPPADCEAC